MFFNFGEISYGETCRDVRHRFITSENFLRRKFQFKLPFLAPT